MSLMDNMRFWLNLNKPVPVKRPEAPAAVVAVEEPVQEEVVAAPVEIEAPEIVVERPFPVCEPDRNICISESPHMHIELPESEKVVPAGAFRGDFVETEDGFLRLSTVQRFEVTEPYPGQWRVDAYVDQFISMKVGVFESEAEARAAVIRMIDGN